jgi:hypothetical protein
MIAISAIGGENHRSEKIDSLELLHLDSPDIHNPRKNRIQPLG